ncbi:hypothetical protein MJG53_019467 [Ovis ammon polii x Ovis aries]|uniref:Uncharacterized protein n=1 Tax=Ovis ammon polii x Ovis aries TaxID=2918886 RepID=A0ACB9TZK3_9CETA|nr:hypothetical protein MJG53_019467 [Ovis ammon polii x Ovis aries]
MTKRHVLQINYSSAWTQALRGCLPRVKRLIKGGKNSPMKGYCWPGQPTTCSPFYLSSLAKLPSTLNTQNSFGHSLAKAALDACKVKWRPGDVCPEQLATPNGKTEKLVVGKGLPQSTNVGFFLCSSKQSASAMGNKTSSFRGARGETKDFLYRFEKCSESWIRYRTQGLMDISSEKYCPPYHISCVPGGESL